MLSKSLQVLCQERLAGQTFLNLYLAWIFKEKELSSFFNCKIQPHLEIPNHSPRKSFKITLTISSFTHLFIPYIFIRSDWTCRWSELEETLDILHPTPSFTRGGRRQGQPYSPGLHTPNPWSSIISPAHPSIRQNLMQKLRTFSFQKWKKLQDEGIVVQYDWES